MYRNSGTDFRREGAQVDLSHLGARTNPVRSMPRERDGTGVLTRGSSGGLRRDNLPNWYIDANGPKLPREEARPFRDGVVDRFDRNGVGRGVRMRRDFRANIVDGNR